MKLARSINGKEIGKFWYEDGDKKGPYRHAGKVILKPGDHILYQGGGSGVMGMMPDQDSWETRMDFFIAESGKSNVMVHIFKSEIEPTRPKAAEDRRSEVQKALSPAALHAIGNDDLDFLKRLIEEGLKINEVLDFKTGETALYHAVWERNAGIVKYLLSQGADPEMRNRYGERPIQPAIKWELKEIIPLLAKSEKKEGEIEGVPKGVIDEIFSSYSSDEIFFLSWNGKDAPKELLSFLSARIPKVRPDSRLETIDERPLGAHSWYRDSKDGGFGSRLQVRVKKVEKGWNVRLRDSVGPAMAGFGWESNYYKQYGYWFAKRVSSWDE